MNNNKIKSQEELDKITNARIMNVRKKQCVKCKYRVSNITASEPACNYSEITGDSKVRFDSVGRPKLYCFDENNMCPYYKSGKLARYRGGAFRIKEQA